MDVTFKSREPLVSVIVPCFYSLGNMPNLYCNDD